MTDRNAFTEREKGLEGEYFYRKEQELIEKMRKRAAREQLAAATGVADEEVLVGLQELGYTPETVSLLFVVPLVQVAWAEGGVSHRERELILTAAKTRGIEDGGPAHAQLLAWLNTPPPPAFFDTTLRAIRLMLAASPEAERTDLITYCTQIAAVSGGFLGLGSIADEERLAIARIATELGQGREAAVKKVIAG